MHARASSGIFVGCNDYGVYTAQRIIEMKIVNSVHIKFDENDYPGLENSESSGSGESQSSG